GQLIAGTAAETDTGADGALAGSGADVYAVRGADNGRGVDDRFDVLLRGQRVGRGAEGHAAAGEPGVAGHTDQVALAVGVDDHRLRAGRRAGALVDLGPRADGGLGVAEEDIRQHRQGGAEVARHRAADGDADEVVRGRGVQGDAGEAGDRRV